MLTSFNKFFETGKFSLHSYSVHSSSSSESEPEQRPKKRKRASSDVATSSSNEELVESIQPPASPTVPDVDTSQPGPSQPTETPPADPAQEIPGRRDDDVEGTTPTSD